MRLLRGQIPDRGPELAHVDPLHFKAHGMAFIDGQPVSFDVVPPDSPLLSEGQLIQSYGGRLVMSKDLSHQPLVQPAEDPMQPSKAYQSEETAAMIEFLGRQQG